MAHTEKGTMMTTHGTHWEGDNDEHNKTGNSNPFSLEEGTRGKIKEEEQIVTQESPKRSS